MTVSQGNHERAPASRLRILFISALDIFPPDTGGMSRIYNLIKELRQWHEVVLISPRLADASAQDLPIKIHEIGAPGRRQFADPTYVARVRSVIRRESPDIILVGFVWSALAVLLARLPLRIPVVMDIQNIESDRFRDSASRWWWAMSLYEHLALRTADQVFVVSEDDRRRLHDLGVSPQKTQLVPNGYDEERFYPNPAAGIALRRTLGIADEERLLLFFGHLRYAPNVEGLQLLHREVLPRLDRGGQRYRLVVAGRGADELRHQYSHPHAIYAGVIDRIEDLINAADTVVVPLLRGGGTRVKIIESIACGTPVVSTPAGAKGLDRAACGDGLVVVDGWDVFACAVMAAANRSSGTLAIPPTFRERYAWSAIAPRIRLEVR